MDEIKDICLLVQGEQNNSLKELLYQLMLDDDRLVAVNALWTPISLSTTMFGCLPTPSRPMQ